MKNTEFNSKRTDEGKFAQPCPPTDPELGFISAPDMDPADYLPDMEEFDLSEAQKIELLETLWDICRRLVELDRDVGMVDPCGQIFGCVDEYPAPARDDVKSLFSNVTKEQSATDEKDISK